MTIELPPLHKNTIMVVEVGSTAHGTGIQGGEDLDLTCVYVETPEEVLGLSEPRKNLMERTVPEGTRSGPGDIDRTSYSLRNFLKLCAAGNPSMLMALWAPVVEITPEGVALRKMASAFIGRHIIPKYRGYARGQALNLLGLKGGKGHGKRGTGQRPELIDEFGYDTKYAMHCARLGFQCIELLKTGKLELPMQGPKADWLRKVRTGEVPFDLWWEEVLWLDAAMAAWEFEESVPAGPDTEAIEKFSVDAHMLRWTGRF